MDKRDAIITDAENDLDVSLDGEDFGGILCNDDGCRSDECGCWDSFEFEVRERALKAFQAQLNSLN